MSKDKHYKYEYDSIEGRTEFEDDMTIIYPQYKLKDTEAVQKAIHALKKMERMFNQNTNKEIKK